MANDYMNKVLKFPLPNKIFHNVNAVTWYILLITGLIAYFKLASPQTMALMMKIHIYTAVIFTLNFIAFVFITPHRFYMMLDRLFTWDKDTFAWFKNFGGYPRMLGIPFGPEEVAPQGKYNAGQKLSYPMFVFFVAVLIVTGWGLFLFKHALGKGLFTVMFYVHVWGSILVSAMATFGHVPLALIHPDDVKAMFRFGPGTVPIEVAAHHNPKWVENEIVEIDLPKDIPEGHHH
ncbi:cytochrome b/b6 domain-containing protein [Desulfurobacterium sp.]